MNGFLITTTDTVEGVVIEKYIELISANIVLGANVFSDFAASFTDIFGGYSNTYQNKLDKIYDAAIKNLQQKAKELGANAIVGARFDFGEISAKGNSMFMVSATGMAVKAKYNSNDSIDNNPNIKSAVISYDRLNSELIRIQIIDHVSKNKLLSEYEWEHLLNNPIDEIFKPLLKRYLKLQDTTTNSEKLLSQYFPKYIGVVNRNIAIDELYCNINSITLDLLKKHQLFDACWVLKLINNGQIKDAISCLSITKSHYTKDDLEQMKKVSDALNNLPDTGHWEIRKGIFGKEQKSFVCDNGHKSADLTTGYCRTCGHNIKGITLEEDKIITNFNNTIKVLNSLL